MAQGFYDTFIENMSKGDIDFDTATVKIVLVDTGYTFNASAHNDLADVTAGLRVATETLANAAFSGRVFDADDIEFTAIVGDDIYGYIIYVDSGVEATSYLIYHSGDETEFPIEPAGADLEITFNAGGIGSL